MSMLELPRTQTRPGDLDVLLLPRHLKYCPGAVDLLAASEKDLGDL